MTFRRRPIGRNRERGQALVLCAVCLIVLLLFVGLALDFGLAYVTKANLGKAADAASLAGAKSLSQGRTQAQAVALAAFNMNYPALGRNTTPPVVNVSYSTDASGNTLVNVNASATIGTYFLGILPQFRTLNVGAAAQATRARVIMSLVLDRSGSMAQNGGGAALPGAVNYYTSLWDNVNDTLSLVTFATDVTTDVPMTTGNFVAPIEAVTKQMGNIDKYFQHSTYSDGGLKNGLDQINSVTVPAGQNVVRVIVFFTDGNANTIYDKTTCTKGTYSGAWGFGELDNTTSQIGFSPQGVNANPSCDQTDGGSNCCRGTFPSQQSGAAAPLDYAHVHSEALYRAIQDGNNARNEGIYVFAIGFSNAPNMSFLQQVANDPASISYDPTKPEGTAYTTSTQADLNSAFQSIASKIMLRLTQ